MLSYSLEFHSAPGSIFRPRALKERVTISGTDRYGMLQHFGVPRVANTPQTHVCCLWSLLFPPRKDLLLHSHEGTRCVLGNEGAERRHLANLAVLAKDIIAFSCLFFATLLQEVAAPTA